VFKFIHTADIHLDSPLRGLPEYPGAPVEVEEIRKASREAFDRLVSLAIEEKVQLVLIAGDLYDGDWPDFNTGLYLAQQMTRLREAEIRVVIARGNHDAASRITRNLKLPDNVTQLPDRGPGTVIFEDLGVAVHGQGFAERHVSENVALNYPAARTDLFNIGMLHTNAGRGGHDPYAPCSVQDLLSRGYQYWALGHIHKRELISSDPWVCFPGNLQGRHIQETGSKGCLLVTVEDGVAKVQERDLEVVRWEVCRVESEGCRDGYEVLERLRSQLLELLDGCPSSVSALAVRMVVAGDSPARSEFLADPVRWTNEARQAATDTEAGRVWLEKVEVEPLPVEPALLEKTVTDNQALDLLQRSDLNTDSLEALRGDAALQNLLSKLPPELREDGLELTDERLFQAASRARGLLLGRLATGGDAQ